MSQLGMQVCHLLLKPLGSQKIVALTVGMSFGASTSSTTSDSMTSINVLNFHSCALESSIPGSMYKKL